MPLYDKQCDTCERIVEDCYEQRDAPRVACKSVAGGQLECTGTLLRVWLPGNANNVIGDEIDVTIKNGLCNPDGTPRRYRSRQELNREAQRRGLSNYVQHL